MGKIINITGKLFHKKNNLGIILVSVLLVTVILLMIGSSMVALNNNNRNYTTLMEKKVQALKIAEAGISYSVYSLKENPSWGTDMKKYEVPMEKVNGKFIITFNRTADKYYSVNRLSEDTALYGTEGITWDNKALPKYSADLIVTGVVEAGGITTTRRLRVILQRDATFGSALSSGKINVSANTFDLSREVTMQNPSEAGSLHSNSIKSGSDFAISSSTSTKILLHGGVITAQGDIGISDTAIDGVNGSKIDRTKQTKNIQPIDIEATIKAARTSIPVATSGGIYLVGKNGITKGGASVTLPGVIVDNGKVYITKDIRFNESVKFEFNYKELQPLGKGAIKEAGIYLQDPSDATKTPSLYVDYNGSNASDLTVAGPIKGNGSVYASGKANFIGESNLVASTSPGVVIVSESDLNMSLPSVSEYPLNIDFTGLVYTHGNANITTLDATSPASPTTLSDPNASWPPDWEDMYLKPLSVKTTEISSMRSDPNDASTTYPYNEFYSSDGTERWAFTSNSGFGKVTQYGSDQYTFGLDPNSSATELNINYSKCVTTTTIGSGSSSGWGGGGSSSTTTTSTWQDKGTLAFTPDPNGCINISSSGVLQGTKTGVLTQLDQPTVQRMNQAMNNYFNTYVHATIGTDKKDPNFHITGALVAIDPNNPVPSAANPDNDFYGNIFINIAKNTADTQCGNLFITQSSKYLKLLQASKAYTGYRWLYWSEI